MTSIAEFASANSAVRNETDTRQIRLAEVLSALTYALDLTEGQRPGHTLRTAIIATRIGKVLELSQEDLSALYYAALLKDSGCSSNAARMAALFGSDDQNVKRDMRLVDWHDRWKLALRTAKNCGVGRSPVARLKHFLLIARSTDMTREIISARCNRGAQIARSLDCPAATSEAIASVDEHWCGMGHPEGKSGREIPVLSRILLLSQTFEAFWTERGVDAARAMIKARRGTWFDPELVDLLLGIHRAAEWWADSGDLPLIEASVLVLEPGSEPVTLTDDRLDSIAHAFASVIDAKTPFTWRHSSNVAAYASVLATSVGCDRDTAREIMRAGLLHDIGKLGISNQILDKPAKLTDDERAQMLRHPVWTLEILERVPAFHRIARSAAQHHERLDGRGYPWGYSRDQLDLVARILAIADVYEAVTADRPYRVGMMPDEALTILRRDSGKAFDGELLESATTLIMDGTFERVANSELPPWS